MDHVHTHGLTLPGAQAHRKRRAKLWGVGGVGVVCFGAGVVMGLSCSGVLCTLGVFVTLGLLVCGWLLIGGLLSLWWYIEVLNAYMCGLGMGYRLKMEGSKTMKKLVEGHAHRYATSGGLEDNNGYIYTSCLICGGWLKTHRRLGVTG